MAELWGDPDDYREANRKKREEERERKVNDAYYKYSKQHEKYKGTQSTADNGYKLETIKSSEVDDLPRIKARLEELESQNFNLKLNNKTLRRKLEYWRSQSEELAELRKIKYSISKDKNRSIIRALKRGIL